MRVLLGLAALAATVPVAPAQAQSFSTAAFGTAIADAWVMTPPRAATMGAVITMSASTGRIPAEAMRHTAMPATMTMATSTATAASIPTSGTTGGMIGRTAPIRAG